MKASTIICTAVVALAAAIRAEHVDVTFDAALTNGTGWAFNDKIKRSTSGEYYVNAKDALVTAPTFPFAVTSIVLRIRLTQSCTRDLVFTPITGGGAALGGEQRFEPSASDTSVAVSWDAALKVRSFTIKSTSGAYNLYLESATILGEPLVAAPGSLAANPVRGTSARISWTNPENAVSNRIDVFRIVPLENPSGTSIEYDFEKFRNDGGNPDPATEALVAEFPAFAGSSMIYLPSNSSGIIQVSSDSARGTLIHSGFPDYTGLALTISARVPNESQEKTLEIWYESDGATNTIAQIELTTTFTTNVVSLAGLPVGTPVALSTEGRGETHHRFQIDYLAFSGGGASTTTNLVKTVFAAKSPAKIDGLERSTEYTVTVAAFDGEGIASHSSSPLAFTTAASDPGLTISVR